MYEITKEFCFEAAHHLPHLPKGHKCARPHGHSYRVQFVLRSNGLDERGFVLDYADLNRVKNWIDNEWDHRDLTALGALYPQGAFAPKVSTAECMARWLFDYWKSVFPVLVEVRVSETAKTWASYRRDDGTS